MTIDYDYIKYSLLPQAFNPAGPVTNKDMFQGRGQQLGKVLDAIFVPGKSIIVYGERGVGKTSMASVVFDIIKQLGHATPNYWYGKTNCSRASDFKSLWHEAFKNVQFTQSEPKVGFSISDPQSTGGDSYTLADTMLKDDVSQARIVEYLKDKYGIWIFDEFNLLPMSEKEKFSDLMKALSDANSTSKIILVGVADDISEIVESHQSVERCTRQVPMPRMNRDEMNGILTRAETICGIKYTSPAATLIVKVSQGFPYITHFLGLESSKIALAEKRLTVGKADVDSAIGLFIDDSQESLRESYRKAIYSPSKNATYEEVLLACSICSRDDFGMFRITDIADALSSIRGKMVHPGVFNKQLNKLCDDNSRGTPIRRRGNKNTYTYKFDNPLLQPYVMLTGIRSGKIAP